MLTAGHFLARERIVDVGVCQDVALAVHILGESSGFLLPTLLKGLAEHSLTPYVFVGL